MQRRHSDLRVVGVLFMVAAIVVALATIFAIIMLALNAPALMKSWAVLLGISETLLTVFLILVTLTWGGMTAMILYAVGGALRAVVNIEENTRYTAIVMRDSTNKA